MHNDEQLIEAQMLSWIRESYYDEPEDVQLLRHEFEKLFRQLIRIRDDAWRGEKWRAANIAITQLRLARSIAVESAYLK